MLIETHPMRFHMRRWLGEKVIQLKIFHRNIAYMNFISRKPDRLYFCEFTTGRLPPLGGLYYDCQPGLYCIL